jgi:hypothetical protein
MWLIGQSSQPCCVIVLGTYLEQSGTILEKFWNCSMECSRMFSNVLSNVLEYSIEKFGIIESFRNHFESFSFCNFFFIHSSSI